MSTSRQLQQAMGAAAAATAANVNITVVTTAAALQEAVLRNDTVDIEIRAHLDLREIQKLPNPLLPRGTATLPRTDVALLYAASPLRSIRGNCSDPDAAAALGLGGGEAAALLPLKPFQCLLVVGDPWLTVNNGPLWLDNLHLKIARHIVQPIFYLVAFGMDDGAGLTSADRSSVYATNVTFQGENRGTASAFYMYASGVSLLVDDCIVSDWAGFRSPFAVRFQSVYHIRNTAILNSRIAAELVDVSYEGIAHLQNVTFSNVTLKGGAVVSTSLNDYKEAVGFALSYYAEDDADFDVAVEAVPAESRGAVGAEFVVVNDTLADCIYLLATDKSKPAPGCPEESVAARQAVRGRDSGTGEGVPQDASGGYEDSDYGAYPEGPYMYPEPAPGPGGDVGGPTFTGGVPIDYGDGVPPAGVAPLQAGEDHVDYETQNDPDYWFAQRLLGPDDDFLVDLREALPPRPPPPASWPEFRIPAARTSNRTSLAPPVQPPAPGVDLVPPIGSPAVAAAESARSGSPGGAGIAGIAVAVLLVAAVVALLVRHVRQSSVRQPCPTQQGQGESLLRTPGGIATTGVYRVSCHGVAKLPRAGIAPECDFGNDNGTDSGTLAHTHRHDTMGASSQASSELSTASVERWQDNQKSQLAAPAHGKIPARISKAKGGTGGRGTDRGNFDRPAVSREATKSPQGPPGEIHGGPSAAPGAVVPAPGALVADSHGAAAEAMQRLLRQLDLFGKQDLLLGRFHVLSRQQQRLGGQAVVQFVRGAKDRRHYAVKFFLDADAFFVEAALYAACFPDVHKTVSAAVAARAVELAAALGSDGKSDAGGIAAAAARFLPQVEAVCDGAAGDLVDPRGRPLPPCIVMEKGESLQDWSERAQPDFFTVLAVLSNISQRLADMHDAGYVHRDLKPANVMWLPRENRWTVIDFGCVAGVGEVAPLRFTLAYAAPEVAEAFHRGERMIASSPALDAWSLGVMAFEMLSGESAFDFLAHGRSRVIAQLRGELPLPWEGAAGEAGRQKLGAFKGPVLQLLDRDPARRVSMCRFHDVCTKLFASRTGEQRMSL